MSGLDEDIEWNLLRTFLAVCRHGSFSAAADALGVKHPTASRLITQLEERLGVVLFERTARGCKMTQAAEELLPSVETMDGAAGQFQKVARSNNDSPEGTVTVAVPDGLALAVILPDLKRFLDDNPAIKIKMDCGLWLPESGRLQPDVALSYDIPKHPNAVARTICRIHYTLFASEAYVAEHGIPTSLADVAPHRFIGHTAQIHQQETWSDQASAFQTLVDPQFTSNSSAVTLAGLRHGVGVNAAPSFIVDLYPELVPLPVGPLTEPAKLFMCTDNSVRGLKTVERTKEWLESLFDPATNKWLRETYEDPHEAWKARRTENSGDQKIIPMQRRNSP